jgi:hypothetical protein
MAKFDSVLSLIDFSRLASHSALAFAGVADGI